MRPAPPARVREERGRWRDTWARVEVGGGHLEGSAPEALHGGGEPAEGGPQAQAQQTTRWLRGQHPAHPARPADQLAWADNHLFGDICFTE